MDSKSILNAMVDTQDGLKAVISRLDALEVLFESSNQPHFEGISYLIGDISNSMVDISSKIEVALR